MRPPRVLFPTFEGLLQDIRYGFRMLVKAPSVTGVAVVALALGTGATTAIFSVINAVLLHPLGKANTDRLVIIYATDPKGHAGYPGQADYFDWRDQARSFETMLAWRGRNFTMTAQDQPSWVYSHRVAAGFFELLGLRPLLGRTFSGQDYQRGSPRVAVLTNRFWVKQFGGDAGVVGRSITLDGAVYSVVGVMPPGDFQLFASRRPDFWIPLQMEAQEKSSRRAEYLGALARLKRGVMLRQAQAEMDVIARRIASEHPDTNKGWGARVSLAADDLVADIRPTFLVLLGAVVLVLLIACANVANLLLARASAREREMAIRAALGAGRARMIRQALTESVLLGAAGGLLGVLLAYASIRPLVGLVPDTVTYVGMGNIRVDRAVLGFSLLLSMLTSILFGLAPAMHGMRIDPGKHLSEGGRGSTTGTRGRRLRSLLVVCEIVLALVLLIGAGLMLQSFQKLQEVDPGFRPNHVITMAMMLPTNRYPPDKVATFFQELRRRIEVLPGVVSVGTSTNIPLRYGEFTMPFTIEGAQPSTPGMEPRAMPYLTGLGYFQTLGIPLLQGRFFTNRDTKESPRVVVINAAMARRYWPGESALDKHIRVEVDEPPGNPPVFTVVGVVGDVREGGLAVAPKPTMYLSDAHFPLRYAVFSVRTVANPRSMISSIQQQVWALDRNQPVIDVMTMDEVVANSLWQLRLSMVLLSLFGMIALVLAASGIYAVMSYAVGERRHEIGIRMALGSSSGEVLRLVLQNGLKLALSAVAVGLGAAFAVNRGLATWLKGAGSNTQTVNQWVPDGQRGLLYGLSPTDPATFLGIAGLLVMIALVASYLPARGASRLDPIKALRTE